MACFYFLGIFFLSTGGTFKVIWRYRRLIPLSITAVHSFEWLIFLKQKKQNQNSYKHREGTPANLVHPDGSGVSECHECVNIHFHLRSQWWCGLTCLFFFVRISWWEYISCYWDDRELGLVGHRSLEKDLPHFCWWYIKGDRLKFAAVMFHGTELYLMTNGRLTFRARLVGKYISPCSSSAINESAPHMI